jgi:hypothetical protein
MVTPASQTSSFHHPTEVHRAIRSSYESEVKLYQPVTGSWNTTAATS